MDPNELLPASRSEFQKKFLWAIGHVIPRVVEALFAKAEASYTSSEQGHYLHACTLMRQPQPFLEIVADELDALMTRSFKTTYNTFRPTSALNMTSAQLSLVDSAVLENELQLNEVTDLFRNEAEDQIRDLNIRIALLFAQETIRERENPFRPYLLARCLANATGKITDEIFVRNALFLEFSHHLLPHIIAIYDSVNHYLAKNGIAAELQFKLKRSPKTEASPLDNMGKEDISDNVAGDPPSPTSGPIIPKSFAARFAGSALASALQSSIRGTSSDFAKVDTVETPATLSTTKVEQLLNTVRNMAISMGLTQTRVSPAGSGAFDIGLSEQIGNGIASHYDSQEVPRSASSERVISTDKNGNVGQQLSWLPQNQSLGTVLRNFFVSGSAPGHNNLAQAASPDKLDAGHRITENEQTTYTSNQDANTFTQAAEYSVHESAAEADHPAAYHGVDEIATDTANSNHSSATNIVQLVHQLQKRLITPVEQMFNNLGGIRNLILEQRDVLNDMTHQVTIDVVAMLFEFILSDPQVPAEVRAQLGRLQFLVLKVALRDSTLLTQKGHPARMLINRIGSISLGLKKIDPSGVKIADEISRIVETLLENDSESSQLFTDMLDELDAFIAKELRESDSKVASVVNVMEDLQHRTLRVVHVTAQLQEVLKQLSLDPYLRDFLINTWVHAIELAERENTKRGLRYRLLVPDLLWSIVPKAQEEDRTQLLALLPIILNTIREGLNSLQWDVTRQKHLLDWLVDAHTAALRMTLPPDGKSLTLPSIHQYFSHFIYPEKVPENQFDEQAPEMQRILDKAIRDLDLQVDLLDQMLESETSNVNIDKPTKTETTELSPEVIRDRLRSGVSLEFNLGFKATIGKLNWIDSKLNHLLLSMEGSQQPLLVSLRMFRHMMANGRVRFLEMEPLFERAVQSLLSSADTIDEPVRA